MAVQDDVPYPSVVSKQFHKGFDTHGSRLCNFGEDAVERTGFQRIVPGDGDRVDRRTFMAHPHVAALLMNHCVPGVFQRTNELIRRNAAWQFHAASTGINSSFT